MLWDVISDSFLKSVSNDDNIIIMYDWIIDKPTVSIYLSDGYLTEITKNCVQLKFNELRALVFHS